MISQARNWTHRVDVVVVTHNSANRIVETLRSVALASTETPLRTWVVDNASTDGTARVVDRYRESVTVLREEKRGASAARNAGLRAASGEIVAYEPATGEPLWRAEAQNTQPVPSLIVTGDLIAAPGAIWLQTALDAGVIRGPNVAFIGKLVFFQLDLVITENLTGSDEDLAFEMLCNSIGLKT